MAYHPWLDEARNNLEQELKKADERNRQTGKDAAELYLSDLKESEITKEEGSIVVSPIQVSIGA